MGIGHLREVHWTIPRALTEELSKAVWLQSLCFRVIQRWTGNLSLSLGYVNEVYAGSKERKCMSRGDLGSEPICHASLSPH